MSGLDIGALRLIPRDVGLEDLGELSHVERVMAKAQLAKALWAFADALEEAWKETRGADLGKFMDDYVEALEQANIERPTDG